MTVFFAAVFVVLLSNCRSDESALQNDAVSKQALENAVQLMKTGQKPAPEDFEKIKKIYQQYPNSKTARNSYQFALISREDWTALEQFLNQIPFSEMSDEDKSNLGKAYFKIGRYADAVESLKPFGKKGEREIRNILATSYFRLDRFAEAKALLDDDWDDIINKKSIDEITLRGMIFFHEKENDKAIETLHRTLKIDPENIAAANGLSRVYAAIGDRKKSEEFVARVQDSFEKLTAEEKRKTNQVEKLYQLQNAYNAKRFDEVIEIANQVLPEADARNKSALYQYLYNSYIALGKQKEAQEIAAKAQQMEQK